MERKKPIITISLPLDILDKVKEISTKQGISISKAIENLINNAISNEQNTNQQDLFVYMVENHLKEMDKKLEKLIDKDTVLIS